MSQQNRVIVIKIYMDFFNICYDVLNKAPDIFVITDFLRSVYDIFSPVATVNDPFYKFVSANILSEMLKYLKCIC